MNSVSIYEKRWLDLVFEGKNKTYGAYQLRLENKRTTLYALLLGLLLLLTISLIPIMFNYFGKSEVSITTVELNTPITLSKINREKPKPPTQAVVPIEKKKPTDIKDKKQLVDPIVVKPIDSDDIAKNTENTPKPITPPETGTGITGKNPTAPTTATVNVTVAPKTGTEIENLTSLDKQPQFPGGMPEFAKYIGRNFKTPDIEEEKILRVYVTFVIEKDGSLTDIKVLRDPGYQLGAEAIRVLRSMKTKWEPGMIAGKPVRTAYTLPITVKME